MEHTQNKTKLQSENQASALKSLPLRLAFILVTGFAVTNIVAHALGLTARALPNPFAAYADIFPGQPASAIEARGFSCPSNYNDYQPPTGIYCTFTPADGVFFHVAVVLFKGKIHQISFIMHKNTLTVGDLELIFETGAVHKFPRTAYFALPRQRSFAIAKTIDSDGRFSVYLPIWNIAFTENALPST